MVFDGSLLLLGADCREGWLGMAALTTYYVLYDLPSDKVAHGRNALAQFDRILGGDRQIDTISYTVVYGNGNSVTRYLPGQVSYAPITLYRVLDKRSIPLMQWFQRVAEGKIEKENCSIVQYEVEKGKVTPTVIWHLYNVLPVAEPGYSYNAYIDSTSTSYQLTIQAEEIRVMFP